MFSCILFGPPCCGKGTQARRITSSFSVHHVSTGDILRSFAKNDASLELSLSQGILIDDDIVNRYISSYLKKKGNIYFCFDGYPRSLSQSIFLDRYLHDNQNHSVTLFFHMIIDKDTAINRMKTRFHNRNDDKIEPFLLRYQWYEKKMDSILSFYDRIVYTIDASLSEEYVFDNIVGCIKKVL